VIQIRSTGENRTKRGITIADESGSSVGLTFWGECGDREDITVGSIVAIKGAKVSDYGGVSLNCDDNSS
jgi:replication factor A1